MCGQHFAIVHSVKLVAGKNQDVFDTRLQDMAKIFANGVGRALVPIVFVVLLVHRLLRRKKFDKAAAEIIEAISAANVTMEACRLKLRENLDLIDLAVDAIRDRNIDESVLAAQWYGRLCAVGRQRQQPSATPTAQN